MLKLAIVGTGIISVNHIHALKSTDCFSLCGVCDINEEKGMALAVEEGVPYVKDYHDIPEILNPDAVILNLPHFLHCEASVFFLEHGIHVLCEKPMANTVEECEKMLEASKKNGKKLAIGHVQRYIPANQIVKETISSERLGKLCMFHEVRTINYFHEDRPKWFLDKEKAGGGIVMNYGAHALDKLFYTLADHHPSIEACVGNFKNDYNVEGHAQFLMKFQNGVSASVTFSAYTNSGYDAVYYFTDGALKVEDTVHLFECIDGKWVPVKLPPMGKDMFALQLEEFYKYINDEPSIVATAEYGRDVIAGIEQIYQK